VYLKGRAMIVGNGKSTSFLHDRWCGLVSLADKFPRLYEISKEQKCTVEYMKLKIGVLLSGDGFMKIYSANLEDYMTLFYRYGINSVNDIAVWEWENLAYSL
jgi:hypothetical protein